MAFPNELYDGSFAGVSFWEQTPEQFGAEHAETEDASVTHFPGGDNLNVQTSGRAPRFVDLTVAVAGSQLTSLRSKRGQSGSLVYSEGTRTARLLSLKWRRSMIDDAALVTMHLLLT